MALDLNTNPGYDVNAGAYAPAAAAATPPQPLSHAQPSATPTVPDGSKLCRRCHVRASQSPATCKLMASIPIRVAICIVVESCWLQPCTA